MKYLDEYELVDAPCGRQTMWGRIQPGQRADGYGSKIATDRKARLPDGRLRRVYATCWSNAATLWVVLNKERVYLR